MEKTRKLRKDSYFGIHFDFHARRTHPVGHHPRPDIFAEMLDAVRPDYLQCDTKGHQGLSSYPTKVGNQAEGITCDLLKMLRELTRERGIALYGHHSGVFDRQAAFDHPDWAVVNAESVVSRDMMSVFGPYGEELLIPQLIELAVDYDLDGVWVDGESWGTKLDYSAHAIRAWQKKTGSDQPPRPGEAGFEDYKEFCRQGFRDHIMRYTTAVKAAKPDFQVTSNWIYSAEVPEKPVIPVDFLSGDYLATNSYESARFHGRCMMSQGMTWDLIAWGQQAPCSWETDDRNTKEAPQYCQEASAILPLGGGFQFFNPQYDGGCTVQKWAIPVWAEVAEFCRARKDYCFGAKSVPQAAVVFSKKASYAGLAANDLFGCDNPVAQRVSSLVQLCCDSQLPNEVLMSHHVMERDLSAYGLILVPDFDEMEPEVIERLRAYAQGGGRLLLTGPDAARAFGFSVQETQKSRLTYIAQNGRMAAYQGRRADLYAGPGEVTNLLYDANYFEATSHPASVNVRTGAGSIEALSFDLANMYVRNRSSVIRDFFMAMADRLFPDRLVRVTGSMYVDLTVSRLDKRLLVHLVNTAGPHRDSRVRGYSEIPPIGPIEARIRLDKEPESVLIQPGNRPADMQWQDGVLTVRVDRLALYDIVEIR